MKLFLDANILFTAAYNREGISAGLFKLARAGKCSLMTSAFAAEEALKNLSLKAPDKLGAWKALEGDLVIVKEAPPVKIAWAVDLPLPLKDAPILAAAMQCSADILVTGDRRDFGHLFNRIIEGVKILPPSDALREVLK